SPMSAVNTQPPPDNDALERDLQMDHYVNLRLAFLARLALIEAGHINRNMDDPDFPLAMLTHRATIIMDDLVTEIQRAAPLVLIDRNLDLFETLIRFIALYT
ncbi:hypothetical protein PFISCL1PPCAC_27263, partial [Pristionchus fissidentatus]